MIFRRRRDRSKRAEEAAAADPEVDEIQDQEDGAAAEDGAVAEVDDGDAVAGSDDEDVAAETKDVAAETKDDAAETEDDAAEAEDDAAEVEGARGASGRDKGPWDASADDFPDIERLDLGAIRVPVVDGFEVQVRMEDDEVVAATVLHSDSGLEIMACAAPKTSGLWDELRGEMIKGLKSSGGRVSPVDGPFGRELVAEVPVTGSDGQQGTQHIRFVGIDGPRWFLRGAFSGRAVDEPKQAEPLEEILRGTVVDRGQQAMAPRELIPLDLPREAREALGFGAEQEAEDESVNRFKSVRRAPDVAG